MLSSNSIKAHESSAEGGQTRLPAKIWQAEGGVDRLCIWPGSQRLSTPVMWQEIRRLSPSIFPKIRKIQRVNQRNGQCIRFDVWVDSGEGAGLCETLRKLTKREWIVKLSSRWVERPARRVGPQRTSVDDQDTPKTDGKTTLRMVSLNINGMSNKRQELDAFLVRGKIHVACLQETLLPTDGWTIRFKSYNCYNLGVVQGSAGKRGMSILVAKSIPSFLIYEGKNKQSQWVRIFPAWAPKGLVIGNLYHGWTAKRNHALTRVISQFKRFSHSWPTVLLGDYNRERHDFVRHCAAHTVEVRHPSSPPGKTLYRKWKPVSAIDYAVYNAAFENLGYCSQKVLKHIRLSDHAPYLLTLHFSGEVPAKKATETVIRINGAVWRRDAPQIALHNFWTPLADLVEDVEGNREDMFTQFVQTTRKVCESINRVREVPLSRIENTVVNTYSLPLAVTSLYKTATEWMKRATAASSRSEAKQCFRTSQRIRKKARFLTRGQGKLSWKKFILNATYGLVDQDSRGWWSLMKSMTMTKVNVCPVTNDDGELVVTGILEQQAWLQHFGRLLNTDSVCEPLDLTKVECKPPLPGLSDRIVWSEVVSTVKGMPSGKAPGPVGIPIEIFKACISVKPDNRGLASEEPPNDMARALLGLINSIYLSHTIPHTMLEKWMIAIPKKGDLTSRDNYRGIVLMDTVLKIIMRIIATRTIQGIEIAGGLIPEQGGFRPKRETMMQVVALFEVLQRLLYKGRRGFAVFIDITKAYDNVPHAALFSKLEAMGVSGRSLEFVKEMYKNTRVKVRTRSGLSESISQNVGVHQGGPFSPVAFSIFINDILEEMQTLGTIITDGMMSFLGLLFADDMVLVAETVDQAQLQLDALGAWGTRWGMTFGVKPDGSKCAVLPIGSYITEELDAVQLMLHGHRLPIVSRYQYLGIPITSDCSTEPARAEALARGTKALAKVRHLLANNTLPTMSRVLIFNNVVVNSAMYGVELWGGTRKACQGFSLLFTKGIRLCYGFKERQPCATFAMGLDIGVKPVYVRAITARIRLYDKVKYGSLPCWLKILINHPHSGNTRSWVSLTEKIRRKLHLWATKDEVVISVGDSPVELTVLTDWLWSRELDRSTSRTSTPFVRKLHEYYPHRPWSPLREWLPLLSRPQGPYIEKMFLRIRVNQFWTAERLCSINYLPAEFENKCPFCFDPVPETVHHMLLVCRQWRQARRPFIRDMRRMMPAVFEHEPKVARILGEYPASPALVGLGEAYELAEHRWEREHVLSRGWIRARIPLWNFLSVMLPRRMAMLRPIIDAHRVCCPTTQSDGVNLGDPRVEARAGMTGAAATTNIRGIT